MSGPIEKTDNAAYNGTKSKRTQTVDSKKRYSKIREMSNDQKYTKTNNGADDTVTDDDDDDIYRQTLFIKIHLDVDVQKGVLLIL